MNTNNQKGFANIVLIIVIIAIVAVGGYFAFVRKSEPIAQQLTPTPTQTTTPTKIPILPTQDKTANWKIYTNTTLGFSIKYPPDWTIDSLRSNREKSGSDVVFDIGIPESHEGIRVAVSNLTLDEWANQADKNVAEGTYRLMIDGQPAIRIDTTEFGQKLIGVKFNGKLYVFTTGGRMIENSMLSTVKFITMAQQPTPKTVDWESLLPSMRTILKQVFPNERIEESRPISIYKTVDVTGDDVPEVLVNLGTGGATTNLVTLMRIENDKPIAPLFKQKDGKISTLIFSAGAGGSGRYGSTAEMLGNKNAIYFASYSKYGESADYCRVEAYQWNSQTKIFEYNAVLSNKVQQDYCRTAGTGL